MQTDCLAYSLCYLDAPSLLTIVFVSKLWWSLADKSLIWQYHCAELWSGKQNKYLERWVDLNKVQHAYEATTLAQGGGDEYMQNQLLQLRIFYFKATKIYERLLVEDPTSPQCISAGRRLQRITKALSHMFELDSMKSNNQIVQDPVQQPHQIRCAMPASQYFLEIHIRREKTLHFSSENLDNEEANGELKQQILQSLSQPLEITAQQMQQLDSLGALMSWKQSYVASLRDSKRTYITYEELRAQGEWLICFESMVEVCRFTAGGYQFFDNRAFFEHCCDIVVHQDHLLFKDIRHGATVSRDPRDWAWIVKDDYTAVSLSSFDRRAGPQHYSGCLAFDENHHKRNIMPLMSPLLDIEMHQLLTVTPFVTSLPQL